MKSFILLYFIFVLSRSSYVRRLNTVNTENNLKQVIAYYNEEKHELIFNDKVYLLKGSESGEHHEVDFSELPTDYIIWNSFIILCKIFR